jgi:hypothetical protein
LVMNQLTLRVSFFFVFFEHSEEISTELATLGF